MANQVQISKGLLSGLVAVTAAALCGLAFLLGRVSVRATPPAAQEAAAAVPQVPPPSPAPEGPALAAPPAARPAPPEPAAPASMAAAIPSDHNAKAEVAAYFRSVESIQLASSGDPEAVAQQIVGGLVAGNTSGLDGMIQQARETRSRLAALAPPRPCAAYHRDLLASLDDGLDMMQAVKKMITSASPSLEAGALTERANAMKAHADSLRAQEKALKQRYAD